MPEQELIATIEGPQGKAEIFEYPIGTILEYLVKFNDDSKTFNNLGEAYIEAGELAGNA